MEINSLRPAEGATKKRKRIGRGPGSGHGKTSTKGHKGQKARSGGSVKAGFEGGQMPMQRRLPKRGFTPLSKKEYTLVKVGSLECFDAGSIVTLTDLKKAGLVPNKSKAVKLVASGELTKALTVNVQKLSSAAREKVVSAGGTIQEQSL